MTVIGISQEAQDAMRSIEAQGTMRSLENMKGGEKAMTVKDQSEKTEFVIGNPCWITKFALSSGIIEEGRVLSVTEGSAWIRIHSGEFCSGTEVFATRKEAIDYAEGMKTKKIAALQRQIDKLKALKKFK